MQSVSAARIRDPPPDTLALMSALLSGDWAVADAASARSAREASGLVAAYVQWHLENRLRSLRLVDGIG